MRKIYKKEVKDEKIFVYGFGRGHIVRMRWIY